MVKLIIDMILREDLRKIYGKPFSHKVKYFWNKGWTEIPEIMVLIPPAIASIFGAIWLIRAQMEEHKKLPRYFNDITIFRPDNPRVSRIRTDDRLSLEQLP